MGIPKILIPKSHSARGHYELPQRLLLQFSRITVTPSRTREDALGKPNRSPRKLPARQAGLRYHRAHACSSGSNAEETHGEHNRSARILRRDILTNIELCRFEPRASSS